MRRVRALFLSLLVIASGGVAIRSASAQDAQYKIGVVLDLSGPARAFGEIARASIDLAVEHLSAADRERIKVVFEDDGLSPTRSVTAARKLIEVDKVDALISWSSSTGLSLASLTEAKKIPHLCIGSDPAVSKGRRYTFTYWALPENEGGLLASELVRRKVQRVAILAATHNGVLALRDAFVTALSKSPDVFVVASEEVLPDARDLKGVLERMKARGPLDAFVTILFPGQQAVAVKQARAVGINAPLYGFETFEDEDDIRAANGLFSGVLYATAGDPTPAFLEAYRARYPSKSYYTASNAFDIVNLLVAGSRNKKDSDAVVGFLRNLRDYPTASGVISSTGDNRFSLPTALKTINKLGKVEALHDTPPNKPSASDF